MNPTTPGCTAQHLLVAAAVALLLTLNAPAVAGPGAHGPNGEHLDAPATAPLAPTLPRLEARSEGFELVAELRPTELVILVDRYATNEPVLNAKLEVESGGLKAVAAHRPEQGDYVVTDAAMLKALASAGEHGLVFTLVAGAESDLLEGTWVVGAGGGAGAQGGHAHGHGHADHDHDHHHDHHHHGIPRAAWIGGGAAALGLLGGIAWWRQRRRSAHAMKGALG